MGRRCSNHTMDARNSPPPGHGTADRGAIAQAERRQAFLHHLALLCAVLVLAITSLSAFMRLSKAGLSCADELRPAQWRAAEQPADAGQSAKAVSVAPTCYGKSLRELQLGLPATVSESAAIAATRLVHRVVASAALMLVMAMVMICFTARPLLWREGRAALALLALALFLAVLGRWSSNARVPAVAMGNLLGGFAMLALCWRLARRGGLPAKRWLHVWAGCGVALLVAQAALGGLLSASFAAESCDSLGDCVAAARGVPWSALNPWREPVLAASTPVNASGALAQTVHRLMGIAVVLVLLPLGLAALRTRRCVPGTLLLALLAAELSLGLLMTGSASLALALAHNVVAALLLSTAAELT